MWRILLFFVVILPAFGQWRSMDGPRTDTGIVMTNNIITTAQGDLLISTPFHGIYRSSNGGESWQPSYSGIENRPDSPNQIITVHTITKQQDGDLFAGTLLGIYRSTNDGFSWQRTPLTAQSIQYIYCDYNDHLFATNGSRYIYTSIDNGETWSQIYCSMNAFLITKTADDTLMVGTYGTNSSYVLKAVDGGNSWKIAFSQSPGSHYTGQLFTIRISGLLLSNHYMRTDTFYLSTNIYSSTDNGKTWNYLNEGIPDNQRVLKAYWIEKDGTVIICNREGMFYRLNPGASKWTYLPSFGTLKSVESLTKVSGKYFASTETKGVFQLDISSDVPVHNEKSIYLNLQ